MTTEETTKSELQVVGLSAETAIAIKKSLQPFYDQAAVWQEKAEAIVITSVEQVDEMKEAREARLALKNIRTQLEEKRKELKEDSLRLAQSIDGTAKTIRDLIQPIESHLKEQEDFAKNAEIKRKEELSQERKIALDQYDVDSSFYDLINLPDEQYEQLLGNSKIAFEQKKAEEERIENERVENERLDNIYNERKSKITEAQVLNDFEVPVYQNLRTITDKEFKDALASAIKTNKQKKKEQEEIRKENERLKEQAELAEKTRLIEKAKAEKQAADRKAIIDNKNLEQQEKLDQERKMRQRLQKQIDDAKKQEDAQRLADQNKLKLQEEADAKSKKDAQLAPDKDKLIALGISISEISLPELTSIEANDILKSVQVLLEKTKNYITEKVESL